MLAELVSIESGELRKKLADVEIEQNHFMVLLYLLYRFDPIRVFCITWMPYI